MIEDDRSGSRRQWLPKDQYTLDFSFGFRLDPALCCNCEGLPEHVADKPPGCASVKGTPQDQSVKPDWPWGVTPWHWKI
ncbi:hypothetical protein [Mesorhizobium mediterraneum]|jgi:hypothetical protein|uniref:hypothetical protein n=1 Tax=Mesorhizobium mediterraneum TaxID=43617 RepID=UPI00177C9A36|nr:hypothetical protein [Mesorhizobium mediterraneum]